MEHKTESEFANSVVKLKQVSANGKPVFEAGTPYRVEDWWDRVTGGSWMNAQGNPAALQYAMMSGFCDIPTPTDDEVLYGKIGVLGYLIHRTWIDE